MPIPKTNSSSRAHAHHSHMPALAYHTQRMAVKTSRAVKKRAANRAYQHVRILPLTLPMTKMSDATVPREWAHVSQGRAGYEGRARQVGLEAKMTRNKNRFQPGDSRHCGQGKCNNAAAPRHAAHAAAPPTTITGTSRSCAIHARTS